MLNRTQMMSCILLGFLGVSNVMHANPAAVEIAFICPSGNGNDANALTNFGGRIAGYGLETVAGNPVPNPYFSGRIGTGARVPHNIVDGNYVNSGTSYDPVNQTVFCTYSSSLGYDDIHVGYEVINGAGAKVIYRTLNAITILQFLGM